MPCMGASVDHIRPLPRTPGSMLMNLHRVAWFHIPSTDVGNVISFLDLSEGK